jgi:hypothetical protein
MEKAWRIKVVKANADREPQEESTRMTQDEINQMVEQAGFHGMLSIGVVMDSKQLEAFAKLVAAKEREACAKVCDSFQARDVGMQPAECAGAIRARGEA